MLNTATHEQVHSLPPANPQTQTQHTYPQSFPQNVPGQYESEDFYAPHANTHQQNIYYAPPPGPPSGYNTYPATEQYHPPHVNPYQQSPPSKPPRPSSQDDHYPDEKAHNTPPPRELESSPPRPPRPVHPEYVQVGLSGQPIPTSYIPPPPPKRLQNPILADADDPSSPVHYVRDPHKIVGYLLPFPKPVLKTGEVESVPIRFLIYTPPPPPLSKPKEGEKEGKVHKVQRKWQQEVRNAKTSTAKTASWEGVKSNATKAIVWGVNKTTTSNLEFLGRVSDGNKSDSDTSKDGDQAKEKVRVDEILLVYPPEMALNDEQMREEFVNTMLRTKSKAQRDSIIATGLLPVGYGIDILATFVWPFGGLGEIDTVWLYNSARGAKTARSVTKRLSTGDTEKDTLRLSFTSSHRIDILQKSLNAECHKADSARFPGYLSPPTETQVLEAIGWAPSQNGGMSQNWEDERWEMSEVKEDFRSNMQKGAKEWKKFIAAYEKNPEKALKKK